MAKAKSTTRIKEIDNRISKLEREIRLLEEERREIINHLNLNKQKELPHEERLSW